ncbi:hypothetical protein CRI93_04540 [Longimonas halophila]|uniref:Capsule assembly Wzi family protein n=1 Tax=Longimonas halophila TaxID=1469170 RepID=A0A2H3NNB8_9BACT|nr:hypothetical protein CRI93_04540 [Longimonas halophila]
MQGGKHIGVSLLIGLLSSLLPLLSHAQDTEMPPLRYHLSTSSQTALHGTTPFWQYANTYGRREAGSRFNGTTEIRALMPYWSWGPVDMQAGAALTTRFSDTPNTAHFSELYGAMRYRALRLRIGRFRHIVGGNEDALSLGSMLISRNATPIPKIELSTPGFVTIPLSEGRLRIQAYWAEGQLGAERHISRARLHQKSLHVRAVGDQFSLTAGVTQNLQWAGRDRPNSLEKYRDVLFSVTGGTGENTVAAYDVAASIDLDTWQLQAYRQFYLEDWVGLLFRSPWDGLWGIDIKRNGRHWVSDVVYEFMNTIQQDALPGLPEGRAGYYTHSGYRSGWTYQGNVLGNPLIRNPGFRAIESNPQVRDEVQNIAPTPNTMVIAHHLGLRGQPTPRTEYEARFTYSRNYGICQDQVISGEGACRIGSGDTVPPDLETIPRSQLRQDQYATHLDVRYLLSEVHGLRLRSSVAVDWGAFDGTQVGLMLGLQWDGTVAL